jgi:uncharacterized phage infection (PIP) family protein YhgE
MSAAHKAGENASIDTASVQYARAVVRKLDAQKEAAAEGSQLLREFVQRLTETVTAEAGKKGHGLNAQEIESLCASFTHNVVIDLMERASLQSMPDDFGHTRN